MPTCQHEAALYGMLVKHLRDRWAEEVAQFNESSLNLEQQRLDEIIRRWFFTPQDELSGLTPRHMIRDEEQGKPSVVPHDHLDDVFHDDCPVCQALKDDTLADVEWNIGLAPDMSLLDEYDDEGYNAKWGADAARPRADPDEQRSFAPAQEARTWLLKNPCEHCFAGNRFYDRQEALDFVNCLYDLGALFVLVDNIYDEPYRVREQGGPYANTFNAYLPREADARAAIRAVFEHELAERQGLDLKPYDYGDTLIFWWD